MVGLHVHAASLLMTWLVDTFMRWAASRKHAHDRLIHLRPRTSEPCLVDGSLCEKILDLEAGHMFWLCESEVSHKEFNCRKAERQGRWVYYCTRVMPLQAQQRHVGPPPPQCGSENAVAEENF